MWITSIMWRQKIVQQPVLRSLRQQNHRDCIYCFALLNKLAFYQPCTLKEEKKFVCTHPSHPKDSVSINCQKKYINPCWSLKSLSGFCGLLCFSCLYQKQNGVTTVPVLWRYPKDPYRKPFWMRDGIYLSKPVWILIDRWIVHEASDSSLCHLWT